MEQTGNRDGAATGRGGRLTARAGLPGFLAVAGLVFAGLVLWADLAIGAALIGFAVVAAAAPVLRALAPTARAPSRGGMQPQRQLTEDLASIAGALPDPCFIIDGQSRVRFENGAAVDTLGQTAAGKPISFLLRAPELGEAIQRTLDTGETGRVTYFERVPVDRWFEAWIAALSPRGRGRPDFAIILLRDVSEAQRIERMRADFVANASHELRTPLASLSGFIETLQGPARDDAAARARFLEIMAEQARRMSRLIDDLMSLSRIELKAHLRPDAVVDLGAVIRHVLDAMDPLARQAGVEVLVELPADPLAVIGDRDELAQVFQNLVHNAIKYGRSGGRIEVTAEISPGTPDRVVASVRDYGPGIEPEHLPRLTERFYRVDAAASRERGGTGLGLAIVKHILARHRGRLKIDSTPGDGARFTVELDSAPDPQRPGQDQPAA